MKGHRLIGECDALVYDYLVDDVMKEWVKADCELHYVGKKAGFHSMPQEQIEALLIELAERGMTVVRLKGAIPLSLGGVAKKPKRFERPESDMRLFRP